jgi:hypothetical protein
MHNASHPEYKEDTQISRIDTEQLKPETGNSKLKIQNSKLSSADPVLREQLTAMRETGWSNNKLAKSLGCNPAYVQLYISDNFPGDLDSFQRKLADFFANESRRRASGIETAECEATQRMRTAFEFIRKTSDMGVITAASGQGKTRAIEHYILSNPLAILYRTTVWAADKSSVESMMFEVVGRSGWNGQIKRAIFMVNKLRGSERFIIVDDAHKLTRPALQWFYDFQDATQCPIALVGTYDLLGKLEDDAQRFSRAGYHEPMRNLDKDGKLVVDRALVKHLVKQLAPGANGEMEALCDLAEQVAEEHGHYRSVHKQLKLAVEIKAGATKKPITWPQAFRSAHTKLIRKYKLN